LSLLGEARQDQVYVGTYVYTSNVVVSKITPGAGPIGGGTRIIVHGGNFINNENIQCWFGNISAFAYFISSTAIECTSPVLPLSTSFISSSNNTEGVQFSIAGNGYSNVRYLLGHLNLRYTYYRHPVLSSVQPNIVKEFTTTIIRVHGNGLSRMMLSHTLFSSSLRCKSAYGNTTKAVWLGVTTVECAVTVKHPEESVDISISLNNGHDWTPHFTSIRVLSALTISNIEPKEPIFS
jgi:hypothetical protein